MQISCGANRIEQSDITDAVNEEQKGDDRKMLLLLLPPQFLSLFLP